MWFWVSRAWFNSNLVVHGLSHSLFAAEIFFRGLHRDVAQQKLNLFQLAPALWQRRARDLRRSCGASFRIPTLPAYCLTTCHTTLSVISVPQIVPILHTQRNNRPLSILDAANQSSTVPLTHEGTGIVRT